MIYFNFFNLLKQDLRYEIISGWKKYFAAAILFILFSCSMLILYSQDMAETPTLGDFLLNILAGAPQSRASGAQVISNTSWILMAALIIYMTLGYPWEHLSGMGKHLLILSKSRISWWISKCIWIIASVFIYYSIALIVTLLFTIICGGVISFAISADTPYLFGFDRVSALNVPPWSIVRPAILLFAMTSAVCLFQLMLSLFIKPLFSYLVTLCMLSMSICFQRLYLIGNYMMAARSENFLSENGMNFWQGLVIAVCMVLFVMTVGSQIFSKTDVL